MAGRASHRRWLRGLMAATALCTALGGGLLAGAPQAHAATVPVRAATHPTYGRVVFDWPERVGFTARVEGSSLIVAFDQPIEAPVQRAVSALPGYLSGGRIAADGKTVEFTLKRPVELKTFRSGNGNPIVIDLLPTKDAPGEAPKEAAPPTAPQTPAQAQPARPAAGTVTVQGNDDATHSRIAFNWPGPVDYTVKRDGSAVTVLFDRAARADLSPVARASLRNIRNVESFRQPDGNLAVTFVAPHGAGLRESRSGSAVVLEVLNTGSPPAKPAEAAQPQPQAPAPAQPQAQTAAAAPAPQAPQAPLPAAPGRATADSRTTASAANAAAVEAPAPARAPQPPVQAHFLPAPAKGEAGQGPALVFDAGGPSSIALFPRAGRLYIVFDKPLPIGAGRIVGHGGELLGAIEPVPATGGTAFRTNIGPMVWPKLERQGTVWRITPAARLSTAPPKDIPIDPEPDFVLGARLLARAPDAAAVVQLVDPDIGDRLHVVPLPVPGSAVLDPHRYADLEVMASYQGVVVRPIADGVSVRPVKEGVELAAAGGLHLSPTADSGRRPREAAPAETALAQAPASGSPPFPAPGGASAGPGAPPGAATGKGGQPPRLFDFAAWQRGGLDRYTENRQELQLAAVNAPDSERPKAQLDLARFYLSQGFAQETLGLLDVLRQNQPDLDGRPEFLALRGAARVLAADHEGAAKDLGDPVLSSHPETALWRAASAADLAADKDDWKTALDGFKAGGAILAQYPEPILGKLALRAAEAALESKDLPFAKRMLDRVIERAGEEGLDRPELQYLRGLYHMQTEEPKPAREQLQAAYDSLDRLYRAKAGLALTELELAEKTMSPSAAAERLGGLTVTWRGDALEMKIRRRMGQALIEAGQYAEGFKTMKETATLAAGTPLAEEIAGDMTRIFGDLYKDGAAHLSTLDALDLYDQFRELTPVGEPGDEIVRQLAERLIQVDLLNRASDLLQHQVEYRLSGPEKARVGTRLASVRLLDNKPEQAIRALELSNIPGIPPELAAERRLMQAKALAELGRGEEALLLLAEDDSKAAELLRVDIAWSGQKWEPAAFALGKVIGPPPAAGTPIEPGTSQLVLNRAVALALAGDGTGLNLLRRDFGPAMTTGPDADAFRVLTRPEQALGLIDVSTVRSRVAEVDIFKEFLKDYRAKNAGAPGA
ncbi:tetratricopeptide repeat protein [Azospirillum sp. SYSU D00513]|uniref:tetratricopeptide repeat protein n=1 Tax=Azospirillum sp. SYSU D00513 TaxID=2812561 RepID=UPI001A96F003|nr:tetratricopeptide repeat protein [Azospirillum sp. SYSU D00513]